MGQNCDVDPAEVVGAAPPQVGGAGADGADGPAYRLAEDLLAVRPAGDRASDAEVRPASGAVAGDEVVGPVYRRVPGGEVVIPTGRVFVRFPDGDDAWRHTGELAGAGYEVEEVPRHAPHTAWVRAAGGDIADALRRLDALTRLPGVRGAEPEMIGRRAWRG
jgi:hypothetical protein